MNHIKTFMRDNMKSIITVPFSDANRLFIFLQNLASTFKSEINFWNNNPFETIDDLRFILDESNNNHLNIVCGGDFSKWSNTPQFVSIPAKLSITIIEHFKQALKENITANYSWRETAIIDIANLQKLTF